MRSCGGLRALCDHRAHPRFAARCTDVTPAKLPPEIAAAPVEQGDASYLQSRLGFNARMAALKVIGLFMQRMADAGLRVVDFSVLSLIHHNPGITSRQLCDALNLLPPNLVGKIGALERRGLLVRRPHALDRRAQSLQLTAEGQALMRDAENAVSKLEIDASARLSTAERRTLIRLLQKVYQG